MDTQVVTGIIGATSFHWAKENFLYEEGKKTDKKDGIVLAIVTEENPTEFISRANGTLKMYRYKLYDSIDFEKFNW